MVCSKCGGKLVSTDTVNNPDANEVYRRKCCSNCGCIVYTSEFEVDQDERFREEWTKYHRGRKWRKERKEKKNEMQ